MTTEYACQFTGEYDCSEPKGPTQILRYRKCLEENTQRYCVNSSYPFKNVVLPSADCERLVDGQIVSGTPEDGREASVGRGRAGVRASVRS